MKPIFLLIALLAGAPVLLAQMNYPEHRVRSKDRLSVQPYFVDNRVVFRSFEVAVVEDGMQIAGELLVDFDCDRAPAEEKLRAGPIMGLKIDVQLFDVTPVLTRNKTSGMVDDIHIDPRSPGRPVEGQVAQCLTSNIESGTDGVRLATANFRLPRLARPLAPGIYHMVASLTFQSQGETQLKQIRWCGDFWGAEDQGPDPVTLERRIYPIIGDKARHEQFFNEVLNVQRKVEGTARLYLGDTLASGKTPVLRAPFNAGDRTPPNFVIWGQLADRIKDVELLKGHPEQADRDLAAFKKNEQLQAIRLKNMQQVNPNAVIADVIKEQEEMTKILKQNALDNLRLLGGVATKEEVQYLVSVTAGRGQVLDQIKQFQDYLISRYWVLLDGYINYGWNTVNRPGSATLLAVRDNDRTKDAKARLDELAKPEKASEQSYIDNLKQGSFKFQAPEITKAAEAYFRRWPFRKDLLAENFTKMVDGKVAFDPAAWDKFRDEFLKTYVPQTKAVLDEIDTSINYHNQTWPATFAEAKGARDDVISLAFAFEYQIRTEFSPAPKDEAADAAAERKAALARQVVDEWKLKVATDPDSKLDPFIQSSQKSSVAVHTQQRGRLETVKGEIKLQDFTNRYKQAIQSNEALPGKKK